VSEPARKREKLSAAEEKRLQKAADALVAAYGGDIMEALKATMIHSGNLEATLQDIAEAYPGLIDISQVQ
jgi:hypothetical protein